MKALVALLMGLVLSGCCAQPENVPEASRVMPCPAPPPVYGGHYRWTRYNKNLYHLVLFNEKNEVVSEGWRTCYPGIWPCNQNQVFISPSNGSYGASNGGCQSCGAGKCG